MGGIGTLPGGILPELLCHGCTTLSCASSAAVRSEYCAPLDEIVYGIGGVWNSMLSLMTIADFPQCDNGLPECHSTGNTALTESAMLEAYHSRWMGQ